MPAQNSTIKPIDRFTLGHVAWGIIFALMGVGFWTVTIGAILFELIENSVKRQLPWIFPEPKPDTFANATIDALAWVAGWGIIQLFPKDPSKAGPLAKTIFGK